MSFFRCTLRMAYRSKEHQNVFHLEDESNLMTQEFIAGQIITHWIPEMRRIQSSQLQYFQIQVSRILVPIPPSTYVQALNILGAVGATQAISFECYRFQFSSLLMGSKHRGYYCLGGLSQGFISQNAEGLPAIGITEVTSMINNLQPKFTGDPSSTGLNLVVAHKDKSTPTRISSITMNPRLTYLKSRKQSVGI